VAERAVLCFGDSTTHGSISRGEQKAAELPRFLAEEATEIEVELLDLADVVAYSPLDGFHLDSAGHAAVGEAVAHRLIAMF
jgi:lysophospholipase L1-like esterase